MNDSVKLIKTSQPRTDAGKFSASQYENKSTHSIRLSDEGWRLLGSKAAAQNKTRTDLIEEAARGNNEREIILKAIESFIELQREDYGENPAQKGKDFSTTTRNWATFNKFMELVKISPWELGIGEDAPSAEDMED